MPLAQASAAARAAAARLAGSNARAPAARALLRAAAWPPAPDAGSSGRPSWAPPRRPAALVARGLSRSCAAAAVPVSHSTRTADADAATLRALFDAPTSAHGSTSTSSAAPNTGLFRLPSLKSPADFPALAQRTLLRAQLLVSRIERAPQHGEREMAEVVRMLDRLSDTLCGVIDAAELVRNAHPDPEWVQAANEAYEGLCGYMNVLNTHTGLYQVVSQVLSDPKLCASLSEEALSVAIVFQRDFEKSGIHLPPASRARFVDLSDELLVLGRKFLSAQPGGTTHALPQEWLAGVPGPVGSALASVPRRNGALQIPAGGWEAQTILKYAPDERARQTAFAALNGAPKDQVDTLEELLRRRADLADLTGSESFAELTLSDKMAKRPENVTEFLAALSEHHCPRVQRNLDELRALKRRELTGKDSGPLPSFNAWDRDYYATQHLRSASLQSSTRPIAPFYSVGTVFAGLSKLFERLYGLRFRAAQTQHGEVWAPDVHRIEVVNEDNEAVGTVYADLYAREEKPPSAAHYTVRCSRRTDADDLHGDFQFGALPDGTRLSERDYAEEARPLEAESFPVRGKEGKYQLPTVVLLCDFVRPSSETGPSLLNWAEVETLFHEMGHALHSMLGRTEYHNVSGTRCATDFVELPSILMEHFVSCPTVVGLVASHHATSAALPYSALEAHLAAARSLESLDTHHQVLLALLDQHYHSRAASDPAFDSTAALCALHNERGVMPGVPGVAAQAHFGHLFGYGATYYSYLFDRAIASRVWAKLFQANPLDREAGEKFKSHVLVHGGGRDPWEMLAEVLEDDSIARGDNKAMQTVGRWGIADVGVEARR